MTVDDVSAYLRLNREVVLRKARKGEIPAVKVGSKTYRFYKEQIDNWLRARSTLKRGRQDQGSGGRFMLKPYPLGVKGDLSRKEIYEG